jgi:hypothetical protein
MIFVSLFSEELYHVLKTYIRQHLSLSPALIYSLPEGLWVFCITITSRFFYISLGKIKIKLAWVPVIVAVGLELCQLLRVTNGRFDVVDIGFSFLFWLVAYIFTDTEDKEEDIRRKITLSAISCCFCYGIVYLAHVIR